MITLKDFTRIILILCVVLPCMSQNITQQQNISTHDFNPEELITSKWYYYLHKDVSQIRDFLEYTQKYDLIGNQGAQAAYTGFLAVIFAQHKDQLKSLLQHSSFSGKTKEVIQSALWISGNGKLITSIFKQTPYYVKSTPVKLLDIELKLPSDLDMMWGAFAASGEDIYLKRIVDVLDSNKPLTGDKQFDLATRATAAWSIRHNMLQHELVNRFIHKEIALRSGEVKQKLENIVTNNAKKSKPFQNCDGDFSAALLITNTHNKEVQKIAHNNKLSIEVAFSGMELTNELMADVTFDFKLLNPAGKICQDINFKNLTALKMITPTRFDVLKSIDFIKMYFKPDAKLGKYQFIATIYDNIGKKSITLKQIIHLIK